MIEHEYDDLHVYSIVAIYSIYMTNCSILFFSLDLIDFKTLNVCYSKTMCPIEFKLTGSIAQANKSLYINFQVILKFYRNT